VKKLSKTNVKRENFAFFTVQNLAGRRVNSFDFPGGYLGDEHPNCKPEDEESKRLMEKSMMRERERSRPRQVRGPEW
jgi:hypothetical protein